MKKIVLFLKSKHSIIQLEVYEENFLGNTTLTAQISAKRNEE